MPRTTKTVTFSLPPEMADRVDEAIKQLGGSRSEFLREAALRYIEECEWRQLLQYGEEKAREKGIGPEDVAGLVEETPGRGQLLPYMRVVLDANVIISGLNFPGNERLILELALRGRFELCLSPFILEEVAGALGHKFGWTEERSSQALRALRDEARVIGPPAAPGGSRGRPRRQPHPGVRCGGFRRLRGHRRPGGVRRPLGSVRARESSTPPGSCRRWKGDPALTGAR